MKILCYGDIHLRDRGSFLPFNSIDANGLTKELNNQLWGLYFVSTQIRLIKPNIVINLGDIFHITEFISTQCITGAYKAFQEIKTSIDIVGAKHFIIPGNHDVLNEQHKISTIYSISKFGELVLEPRTEMLQHIKFYMLPWSSDIDYVNNHIKNAENNSSLLFTHLDFWGAIYESGKMSQSPISPKLKIPCIAADVHTAMDIDSVSYVGSLVQNTFHRDNLDCVGGIILYEDGKIKRIPNNLSRHYIKLTDDTIRKVKKYSPEQVVIKVISANPEQYEELLKDYSVIFHKQIINPDIDVPMDMNVEEKEPRKLFEEYVNNNKPEALPFISILDAV